MDYAILALLTIIVISIILSIISNRMRIKDKQKRFSDRAKISSLDIYKKFYKDKGLNKSIFLHNWKQAASILNLDPDIIRPSDRFSKELGPRKGDGSIDETEDFSLIFLKYLNILKLNEKDIEKPYTFGEFVELITKSELKL